MLVDGTQPVAQCGCPLARTSVIATRSCPGQPAEGWGAHSAGPSPNHPASAGRSDSTRWSSKRAKVRTPGQPPQELQRATPAPAHLRRPWLIRSITAATDDGYIFNPPSPPSLCKCSPVCLAANSYTSFHTQLECPSMRPSATSSSSTRGWGLIPCAFTTLLAQAGVRQRATSWHLAPELGGFGPIIAPSNPASSPDSEDDNSTCSQMALGRG